jgi:hypothetical protein
MLPMTIQPFNFPFKKAAAKMATQTPQGQLN